MYRIITLLLLLTITIFSLSCSTQKPKLYAKSISWNQEYDKYAHKYGTLEVIIDVCNDGAFCRSYEVYYRYKLDNGARFSAWTVDFNLEKGGCHRVIDYVNTGGQKVVEVKVERFKTYGF